jgi:hypothetical protein
MGQSELTFKPEIAEYPRELYGSPQGKLDISKEEQWDRLLKGKKDDIELRERLRQEKEAKEVPFTQSFSLLSSKIALLSPKSAKNTSLPPTNTPKTATCNPLLTV